MVFDNISTTYKTLAKLTGKKKKKEKGHMLVIAEVKEVRSLQITSTLKDNKGKLDEL